MCECEKTFEYSGEFACVRCVFVYVYMPVRLYVCMWCVLVCVYVDVSVCGCVCA